MMRTAVACAALGWMLAANQTAAQDVLRSAYHDYRVVTVADGLDVPWSVAWLPDGDMLVTERPGRLRIVRDGTLLPDARLTPSVDRPAIPPTKKLPFHSGRPSSSAAGPARSCGSNRWRPGNAGAAT